MTKKDKGHYAVKHPKGTELDERIADAIKSHLKDETLSCASATSISKELCVSMAEVGRTADLLEVRISKCILGLFGMSSKAGGKTVIKPAETVPLEMETAIRGSLEEGRLPCEAAWKIADSLGSTRGSIAGVCDCLEIKISRCQIGAF